MAVLRVNHGRAARTIADQLQNDFLVLGAIVMVSARRMLHEAAGLDRHRCIRIKSIARPRPPRALDYNGVPVIVTYHPAYLLRDPRQKRLVWEDMQKVMEKLGLEIPKTAE